MIGLLAVTFLLFSVAGCGVTYAALEVPLPGAKDTSKTSIIYFSDGKSEMARLSVENRIPVKLEDVPKHVRDAVVAAEDRSFYTNNGISPKGIVRAVWANVRGEEVQGGSTITQQYIKNAVLTQERTFSRKMKEILYAVKADQEYDKDEILGFYLNTIAFGRGAYGIEAAAQTYFGRSVKDLTPAEGAVLAANIKAPSYYDPAKNPNPSQSRWKYVVDGMVEMESIDEAEAGKLKYPEKCAFNDRPPNKNEKCIRTDSVNGGNGSKNLDADAGHIVNQVIAELGRIGIDETELRTGGYKITTTINGKTQKAARDAVTKQLGKQAGPDLGSALVAVDPKTGEVRAYYGGKKGFEFDLAGSPHPAGSSMKAYVLAAALQNERSVNSLWDGSSPREFPESRGDKPLRNSEDAQCPRCTLREATVRSINTVFWDVAETVGPDKVADIAKAAGIRTLDGKPIDQVDVQSRIGIGEYGVTPLDNAVGYATFANEGKHADPYFVKKVERTGDSEPRHTGTPKITEVWDGDDVQGEDIAADASDVMKGVVEDADPLEDREAAGKTGTVQYGDTGGANSHAWMAGYTPQMAAAVWVGRTQGDGPIKTKDGGNIFGSGLPSDIWKAFMDAALEGEEEAEFPEMANVGDDEKGGEIPEAEEEDSDEDSDDDKPKPDDPKPDDPKPSLPFPRPTDPEPSEPSPSFPGGRD